jgi:addiction module RelE/StbE family toxin
LKLRYTRRALREFDFILDYIAEQSPQGAQSVYARVQSIVDILRIYPLIGARTDGPAIRRLTTTPYPYLVFYEVAEDEVVIHSIRHAARRGRP